MTKDIVCFAGCDWWYHNRGLFCPQIMMRLAEHHKVLFINSLGMRVPSLKKDKHAFKKIIRKLKSFARYYQQVTQNFGVMTPLSVPSSNPVLAAINHKILRWQVAEKIRHLGFKDPVYYIGCPPAIEIVKELRPSYTIYERTDIFSEMPGVNKEYIGAVDLELSRDANMVLYVNRQMYEEGCRYNPGSVYIGHGVDYELFVRAQADPYVPEDMKAIRRPIVGFFGDISTKTSDFDLIEYIVKESPGISFVMVGPISADIHRFVPYKNIHFLGPKKYDQIPHYGKMFDVAIMPWNQNRWIEYCNPVKTKEYLAIGKPIVSMYYPEVKPYEDLIYVAHSPEAFLSAICQAIRENNEVLHARRREAVQEETWDRKSQIIEEHLRRTIF